MYQLLSNAATCFSSRRSDKLSKYPHKTMKYKFEVTQTIYKYIEVEASDESDASGMVDKMLGEGEIRFDDEPFLKTECNYALLPSE